MDMMDSQQSIMSITSISSITPVACNVGSFLLRRVECVAFRYKPIPPRRHVFLVNRAFSVKRDRETAHFNIGQSFASMEASTTGKAKELKQ